MSRKKATTKKGHVVKAAGAVEATEQPRTPYNLPITGWNERPMTSEDFARVCRRERITVHRLAVKGCWGLYTKINGNPTIYINPSLKGTRRLQVEFHELAHHFLHGPQLGLIAGHRGTFCQGTLTRTTGEQGKSPYEEYADVEADIAACIAIAPAFPLAYIVGALSKLAAKARWRSQHSRLTKKKGSAR